MRRFHGRRRGGDEKPLKRYFDILAEALEVQVFQPDEFMVDGDMVMVLGHERMVARNWAPNRDELSANLDFPRWQGHTLSRIHRQCGVGNRICLEIGKQHGRDWGRVRSSRTQAHLPDRI